MREIRPRPRRFPHRGLGKSWCDWDGNVETHEGDLREGPALFFLLLAFGLSLASIVLVADAWLLIRHFFHPYPIARTIIAFGIGAPLCVWWLAYFMSLAALTRGFRACSHPWLSRWLPMQTPFLAFCGRPFGVSRDRIASSCLAVTNALARLQLRTRSARRPILLLPRCVDRESIEACKALAAEQECPIFVMGTNKRAREKVKEHRATCVLAVACERDLISGVYDFGHKMPVLAVANRRPNGPCMDSRVDLDDLRAHFSALRKAAGG